MYYGSFKFILNRSRKYEYSPVTTSKEIHKAGQGLITGEQWPARGRDEFKLLQKSLGQWNQLPRERQSDHMLIIHGTLFRSGDSWI